MQKRLEDVVIDSEGNIMVWRDHSRQWHWIKKCKAAAFFNYEKETKRVQGKNGNQDS